MGRTVASQGAGGAPTFAVSASKHVGVQSGAANGSCRQSATPPGTRQSGAGRGFRVNVCIGEVAAARSAVSGCLSPQWPHRMGVDLECADGPAMQANEAGVKVQLAAPDEDEDEDWGDAMAELEDPWMRHPVVPELLEEELAAAAAIGGAAPAAQAVSQAAGAAGTAGSRASTSASPAPAAAATVPGQGPAPAAHPAAAVEDITVVQLRDMLHWQGGGAGSPGGLVLLDVRSPDEASSRCAPSSAGQRAGSMSSVPLPLTTTRSPVHPRRPPWPPRPLAHASTPWLLLDARVRRRVPAAVNVPIGQLDAAAASALADQGTIVVLGTADHRSQQVGRVLVRPSRVGVRGRAGQQQAPGSKGPRGSGGGGTAWARTG